jgi:hypothetical protein
VEQGAIVGKRRQGETRHLDKAKTIRHLSKSRHLGKVRWGDGRQQRELTQGMATRRKAPMQGKAKRGKAPRQGEEWQGTLEGKASRGMAHRKGQAMQGN